ncbi:hypothetical protein STENM223S_06736 [Streptomyces tendae]
MLTPQVLAFETDCHIFDGSCGFPAPERLHSFLFDPIFSTGPV